MSTRIGIVSEGISDYWTLKHIVERYLRDCDVYTIPLKPKVTTKGKQEGFGTWQGVFDYISGSDENKLIIEAVNEGCHFVIIQIDTDVCEQYGVDKNPKDSGQLWVQVKEKLEERIHSDFDKSILLFAICIDELECWLIPFVSTDKVKCNNTDRCLNILNKNIKPIGTIDKHNKNCIAARKVYDTILSNKKKPKDIADCAQYNYGFQEFIKQLDQVKSTLQKEQTVENGE
jgi:hypothetical protein